MNKWIAIEEVINTHPAIVTIGVTEAIMPTNIGIGIEETEEIEIGITKVIGVKEVKGVTDTGIEAVVIANIRNVSVHTAHVVVVEAEMIAEATEKRGVRTIGIGLIQAIPSKDITKESKQGWMREFPQSSMRSQIPNIRLHIKLHKKS